MIIHVNCSTHFLLDTCRDNLLWRRCCNVNVYVICSELMVRSGFQGLQLVVTDFLPSLSVLCLPVCITVAGQYGVQNEDLNISLTSIGLLVNDYIIEL